MGLTGAVPRGCELLKREPSSLVVEASVGVKALLNETSRLWLYWVCAVLYPA